MVRGSIVFVRSYGEEGFLFLLFCLVVFFFGKVILRVVDIILFVCLKVVGFFVMVLGGVIRFEVLFFLML